MKLLKLNDNISNVNTIVSDVVAGELEYYERKIFKGAEPPETHRMIHYGMTRQTLMLQYYVVTGMVNG